jgi:hypothetical protein
MYHFHSEAFHHQDTKAQRILGVLVVDSKTQIFILNRYNKLLLRMRKTQIGKNIAAAFFVISCHTYQDLALPASRHFV